MSKAAKWNLSQISTSTTFYVKLDVSNKDSMSRRPAMIIQ